MRRKAVIFCCTLLVFVSVSCAGARNSRILRENPGPGADSYREAGESSGSTGDSEIGRASCRERVFCWV